MSYCPYVSEKYQKTSQFQKQYSSQGGKCAICKNHLPIHLTTRDHIVPKAAGGKNGWANLQLVCQKCNIEKGKKFNPSWPDKFRLFQISLLTKIAKQIDNQIKIQTIKIAASHGHKITGNEKGYYRPILRPVGRIVSEICHKISNLRSDSI